MDSFPFKQHILLATGIGLCMSVLYLTGFWICFGFNALEYISITDVASHSVLPLVISLSAPVFGYVIQQAIWGNLIPPGGGADTPIGRFGRRNWRWMLLGIVLAIFVVLAAFDYEMKLILVPLFFSLFSIPLAHMNAVIEFIPNPRFRAGVLHLSILLPALSLSFGIFEGNRCKYGVEKFQVDLKRTKIEFQADDQHPVIYLGFLSGSFVFYEQKTRSIVVVKQKDDVPIFIRRGGRT